MNGAEAAVLAPARPAQADAAPRRAQLRRRRRAALGVFGTYSALVLGCAMALAPIAWGLLTSLKKQANIAAYPPQWLPDPVTVEHYVTLLTRTGVPQFLLNSLILSLGTVAVCLVVAPPAAYAAARFRFRAKRAVLLGILATSMIPGIAILIPLYLLAVHLGVLNSRAFMILAYAAWLIPQSIWLIKGFIETVPIELEEAAVLDGCSTLGVFVRIILPLIQPGLAAVGILVFIFVWNDFLIASALATEEQARTVQVGLVRYIQDTMGVWWGQFMAFAMLAVTPSLLAFLIMQRRFVEGLTGGAVKG